MKHRKLRIAWSVAWGIVAVLLVALWVRSHWYANDAGYVRRGDLFGVESACGSIRPFINAGVAATSRNDWFYSNESLAKSNHSFEHPIFGWDGADYPATFMAYFPHWLPALLLASVAAAPWITWSNRFSLRTLLIATTLVAVGLGLIVWLR